MTEKEKQELDRLREREAKAKARFKRQNEAIKEKYERITVTVPKGTKERILETGESLNGYINRIIQENLY